MTPLASPLYVLGAWVGNATDDQGVDWIVETEDGWSSTPPVRASSTDRDGSDGADSGPSLYSARVITLTGTAIAPNQLGMLNAKERIKTGLPRYGQATLQVQELHATRQAQVRLSDVVRIVDKGANAFTWQLSVAADDPLKYSQPVSQSTGLVPPHASSGLVYPLAYPLNYGEDNSMQAGALYVANQGFATVKPQLRIVGPVTNPRVFTAASQINVAATLSAADVLSIDCRTRRVLLNGASWRWAVTASGPWLPIPPGGDYVHWTSDVYSADASLTITSASGWE